MNKRKEAIPEYKNKDAIQEAIDYGLDVTLLYERVTLTPTERIERHQQSLEFAEELKRAGERKYGKS
ncbi:MAG: hypothetical protein QME42_09070 [bacterium]|nr:hypothetical protein [bacterium]